MLFYKVTATLCDAKWAKANNDRRTTEELTRQLAVKSEDFNEQDKQGHYCFIANIGRSDITCGILSLSSTDALKLARSYCKYLGIAVKEPEVCEITCSYMETLLSRADGRNFIEDDDDVLERFGLGGITGFRNRLDYGENLLDEATVKSALYDTSNRLLADETLRPELDRIYSGKATTKAFGHPVHYMIETDSRDTRKELSHALLQALYDNRRIHSRRYCFIDFVPGRDFPRSVYDTLYKSCTEGAILVRYLPNGDADTGGYAGGEMDMIAALCEAMMKYRNRVLTVFCLPRACEKTKKLFYENLGSVGIVEIKEDLADVEKATGYLTGLCKETSIRPDKKLFNRLEPEKQYLPDELRAIFDEWYNNKMKTSVFPQYKDLAVCRKEAVKETTKGNAYDELQELIGLAEAKAVIHKALNYYKIQRLYKDKGIRQDRPAMHMVFTGNPGTAKTTVARLFARIMKENGLLSKGHLVEVGRGDLVGKYVGWTAQIVKDKFKKAMGGVLFIDEAYSLVDDRGGSFGDEAINTIVQEMENRREDMVVIFAGYPDEMEGFLDKNPGLRSRIAFHVPFADYDTAELCEIAKLIAKSKRMTLTDGAVEKLADVFDEATKHPDFGNGRYVRNVLELSKMNQASRLLEMDPDTITESELTSITAQDIEVPPAKQEERPRKMGFCA